MVIDELKQKSKPEASTRKFDRAHTLAPPVWRTTEPNSPHRFHIFKDDNHQAKQIVKLPESRSPPLRVPRNFRQNTIEGINKHEEHKPDMGKFQAPKGKPVDSLVKPRRGSRMKTVYQDST